MAGFIFITYVANGYQCILAIIDSNKVRQVKLKVVITGNDQEVFSDAFLVNPEI